MNEVLVLERIGDPDDSMFSCYTGTIDGNRKRNIATFWEGRRAEDFVGAYLRKTGKSIKEYKSIEEILMSFISFCWYQTLEPQETKL